MRKKSLLERTRDIFKKKEGIETSEFVKFTAIQFEELTNKNLAIPIRLFQL